MCLGRARRFDPNRFREIPRIYEHTRGRGFLLPEGLLVERRNAAGEETPFTGSYLEPSFGSVAIIVLSYNAAQQTASFIFLLSTAGQTRGNNWTPSGWGQRDARFVNGVIRDADERGNLRLELDLNTRWAVLPTLRLVRTNQVHSEGSVRLVKLD